MDKFQSRRSWQEISVLFALIVLALFTLYHFRDYTMISPLPGDPNPLIERITDSVIATQRYNEDSLSVSIRPVSDENLTSGLSDSLGVFDARSYIVKKRIPAVFYEVTFFRSTGNAFTFNTGQAVRSRSASSDVRRLSRVFITQEGKIIGSYYTDANGFEGLDSVTTISRLIALLPPEYRGRSYSWTRDTSSAGSAYFAETGDFAYHRERILVRAQPLSVSNNAKWEAGWEKEFIPKKEFKSVESEGHPVMGAVIIGIIAIVVVALAAMFIMQLRKRAISFAFFAVVAVSVSAYFFASSISSLRNPPLIAIIVILIGCLIMFGFILAGMPVTAIVSLAQEKYPAKFYTLRRFMSSPWRSHYVGKSLLWAIATALVNLTLFPILLRLQQGPGDMTLYHIIFNAGWTWLSLSPVALIMGMFFFTPLIQLGGTLLAPAISYRLPKKYRFLLTLLGTMLFNALISTMTDDNEVVTLNGAISGLLAGLLFWYVDVLAILVMGIIHACFLFLPLAEAFPFVSASYYIFFAATALLAVIAYAQPPEEVTEEDYTPEFASRLADERRIREELSAAKIVQSRLLPTRMPSYPELDIAATCIPTYEVGGDYYDFFHLDEHRLGILIGDVSGKGMSAAFYITLAKGVIVSQVKMALSPADVLSRVNKLLYETMERGKFISLIYGIFDTRTMEFTYAQAGHNPIIVRDGKSGTATMLEARGLALGLDSGKIFDRTVTNHTIRLHTDDALIMYTDGVTEAVNSVGTELGDSAFVGIIEQSSGSSAECLGDILSRLRNFIGKAKQRDDITLVIIKCAQGAVALPEA